MPSFNSLKGNVSTDVLIIGGGMAGILTAYFLHQKGIKYILVEKDTVCSGTTCGTTAKITYQHSLIYSKLLSQYGAHTAQLYLKANESAFLKYAELCKTIDCDYEVKDNYVYSLNSRKELEDELNALNAIGFAAQFCEELPLPFKTAGAVQFKNQAQFHPLKFILNICKCLNIYENTFVKEFTGNCVVTDNAKITAKKIIVATHFPFLNKHGSYFLKLYQHRSYVSAFSGCKDLNGMYVDSDPKGLSFKNYKDLLIIGGFGDRTGKSSKNWQGIAEVAKKYYPNAQREFYWAAQDCMSLDGIPYIGKYCKNTPNLYVASGFNKWGITGSMLAAMLLCDAVWGTKNEFASVFNPSRSILKPQLFINGLESAKNLLSVSKKRCPHLGCALKWNSAEHSWDCPCHGSRFNNDGKVLENPANGDIN